MKLLKYLFLSILLTSFISCSSQKTEMDDSIPESVGLDDVNDYSSEDGVLEDKYSSDTIEEEIAQEEVAQEEVNSQETPSGISTMPTGEISEYTVKKGDTLMLISFQLYGDYEKWRHIQELNPEVSSIDRLSEGQKLKVQMPEVAFDWRPDGEPYLIKPNETLQVISNNIYETTNKWRHLYEHNKSLIKDPNIIFAGFTIYYLPSENRDPANE